ncbi:hypothetical protein [uncultured Azonexus sp.]|uniref:hypothetical protein n=1 Tax=uncultured Azonexus sp. TaxID=520307 RepID=UPI001BBB4836|nr:hypothetical protein [uncultured Azonexus sp.]MBS4017738.1 hypothetical protein [Dechloromonas sp.]
MSAGNVQGDLDNRFADPLPAGNRQYRRLSLLNTQVSVTQPGQLIFAARLDQPETGGVEHDAVGTQDTDGKFGMIAKNELSTQIAKANSRRRT